MPTYEYRCLDCHQVYEKREGYDAPALQRCPSCGGSARRVIYATPIVFKGSGFYVTDSRKPAPPPEADKSAAKVGPAKSDGAAASGSPPEADKGAAKGRPPPEADKGASKAEKASKDAGPPPKADSRAAAG